MPFKASGGVQDRDSTKQPAGQIRKTQPGEVGDRHVGSGVQSGRSNAQGSHSEFASQPKVLGGVLDHRTACGRNVEQSGRLQKTMARCVCATVQNDFESVRQAGSTKDLHRILAG